MANLAQAWGWSLESMDRMPVEELLEWHELALERNQKEG